MGQAAADRRLGKQDIRTLTLASLGGALEFYDFIVFVFFAAAVSAVFFPTDMPDWLKLTQTYGIFAAGYIARPLGGVVMAHFGDLIGRKRMFVFSVFLMAVPTLLIGCLPTFETIGYAAPILLLLCRIMQGAAIGGEAPGAWVFVAEHAPPGRVGFACGMLTSGLTLGILLGSLMALAMGAVFTEEAMREGAWRIPFLVGGVFGFVAMYLRRFLEETPVFEEMRRRAETAGRMPLGEVLRDHRGAVVVSALATWMLTAAIVVLILMTPQFMRSLHGVSALDAALASVAATAALTVSCTLNGLALDRFGVRAVAPLGVLAMVAASYALYLGVAAAPSTLPLLYALTGFTVGSISVVPYMMVRAFPPAVRFSGVSFSYNAAYAVFGGLTPILVDALMKLDALAPAHYVAGASLIGVAAVIYAASRGRAA